MSARGDLLPVEVSYALPREQVVLKLDVAPGSCVREAIEQSGVMARYPQIDLARDRVGIHSRLVSLEEPLKAGDRVEIYRPLVADPKEVRRQRAAREKTAQD